ncbi:MAG: hypothetical protein JNK26_01885, partial [Candidatus Doudnabacteria bacterium]|nr:hypothetical protein [Candidatus Doudnabacteria bacterium]
PMDELIVTDDGRNQSLEDIAEGLMPGATVAFKNGGADVTYIVKPGDTVSSILGTNDEGVMAVFVKNNLQAFSLTESQGLPSIGSILPRGSLIPNETNNAPQQEAPQAPPVAQPLNQQPAPQGAPVQPQVPYNFPSSSVDTANWKDDNAAALAARANMVASLAVAAGGQSNPAGLRSDILAGLTQEELAKIAGLTQQQIEAAGSVEGALKELGLSSSEAYQVSVIFTEGATVEKILRNSPTLVSVTPGSQALPQTIPNQPAVITQPQTTQTASVAVGSFASDNIPANTPISASQQQTLQVDPTYSGHISALDQWVNEAGNGSGGQERSSIAAYVRAILAVLDADGNGTIIDDQTLNNFRRVFGINGMVKQSDIVEIATALYIANDLDPKLNNLNISSFTSNPEAFKDLLINAHTSRPDLLALYVDDFVSKYKGAEEGIVTGMEIQNGQTPQGWAGSTEGSFSGNTSPFPPGSETLDIQSVVITEVLRNDELNTPLRLNGPTDLNASITYNRIPGQNAYSVIVPPDSRFLTFGRAFQGLPFAAQAWGYRAFEGDFETVTYLYVKPDDSSLGYIFDQNRQLIGIYNSEDGKTYWSSAGVTNEMELDLGGGRFVKMSVITSSTTEEIKAILSGQNPSTPVATETTDTSIPEPDANPQFGGTPNQQPSPISIPETTPGATPPAQSGTPAAETTAQPEVTAEVPGTGLTAFQAGNKDELIINIDNFKGIQPEQWPGFIALMEPSDRLTIKSTDLMQSLVLSVESDSEEVRLVVSTTSTTSLDLFSEVTSSQGVASSGATLYVRVDDASEDSLEAMYASLIDLSSENSRTIGVITGETRFVFKVDGDDMILFPRGDVGPVTVSQLRDKPETIAIFGIPEINTIGIISAYVGQFSGVTNVSLTDPNAIDFAVWASTRSNAVRTQVPFYVNPQDSLNSPFSQKYVIKISEVGTEIWSRQQNASVGEGSFPVFHNSGTEGDREFGGVIVKESGQYVFYDAQGELELYGGGDTQGYKVVEYNNRIYLVHISDTNSEFNNVWQVKPPDVPNSTGELLPLEDGTEKSRIFDLVRPGQGPTAEITPEIVSTEEATAEVAAELTDEPTEAPTATTTPSYTPTLTPTPEPSNTPTPTSTTEPTATLTPTDTPTDVPTQTLVPTDRPTNTPTEIPTDEPTTSTAVPTETPTVSSALPTDTVQPSLTPETQLPVPDDIQSSFFIPQENLQGLEKGLELNILEVIDWAKTPLTQLLDVSDEQARTYIHTLIASSFTGLATEAILNSRSNAGEAFNLDSDGTTPITFTDGKYKVGGIFFRMAQPNSGLVVEEIVQAAIYDKILENVQNNPSLYAGIGIDGVNAAIDSLGGYRSDTVQTSLRAVAEAMQIAVIYEANKDGYSASSNYDFQTIGSNTPHGTDFDDYSKANAVVTEWKSVVLSLLTPDQLKRLEIDHSSSNTEFVRLLLDPVRYRDLENCLAALGSFKGDEIHAFELIAMSRGIPGGTDDTTLGVTRDDYNSALGKVGAPTYTNTPTPTLTPSNTPTSTPTNTPTTTFTPTPTSTLIPTDVPTETPSSTPTETPTNTSLPTDVPTLQPPTQTPTSTQTNTPTSTNTVVPLPTETVENLTGSNTALTSTPDENGEVTLSTPPVDVDIVYNGQSIFVDAQRNAYTDTDGDQKYEPAGKFYSDNIEVAGGGWRLFKPIDSDIVYDGIGAEFGRVDTATFGREVIISNDYVFAAAPDGTMYAGSNMDLLVNGHHVIFNPITTEFEDVVTGEIIPKFRAETGLGGVPAGSYLVVSGDGDVYTQAGKLAFGIRLINNPVAADNQAFTFNIDRGVKEVYGVEEGVITNRIGFIYPESLAMDDGSLIYRDMQGNANVVGDPDSPVSFVTFTGENQEVLHEVNGQFYAGDFQKIQNGQVVELGDDSRLIYFDSHVFRLEGGVVKPVLLDEMARYGYAIADGEFTLLNELAGSFVVDGLQENLYINPGSGNVSNIMGVNYGVRVERGEQSYVVVRVGDTYQYLKGEDNVLTVSSDTELSAAGINLFSLPNEAGVEELNNALVVQVGDNQWRVLPAVPSTDTYYLSNTQGWFLSPKNIPHLAVADTNGNISKVYELEGNLNEGEINGQLIDRTFRQDKYALSLFIDNYKLERVVDVLRLETLNNNSGVEAVVKALVLMLGAVAVASGLAYGIVKGIETRRDKRNYLKDLEERVEEAMERAVEIYLLPHLFIIDTTEEVGAIVGRLSKQLATSIPGNKSEYQVQLWIEALLEKKRLTIPLSEERKEELRSIYLPLLQQIGYGENSVDVEATVLNYIKETFGFNEEEARKFTMSLGIQLTEIDADVDARRAVILQKVGTDTNSPIQISSEEVLSLINPVYRTDVLAALGRHGSSIEVVSGGLKGSRVSLSKGSLNIEVPGEKEYVYIYRIIQSLPISQEKELAILPRSEKFNFIDQVLASKWDFDLLAPYGDKLIRLSLRLELSGQTAITIGFENDRPLLIAGLVDGDWVIDTRGSELNGNMVDLIKGFVGVVNLSYGWNKGIILNAGFDQLEQSINLAKSGVIIRTFGSDKHTSLFEIKRKGKKLMVEILAGKSDEREYAIPSEVCTEDVWFVVNEKLFKAGNIVVPENANILVADFDPNYEINDDIVDFIAKRHTLFNNHWDVTKLMRNVGFWGRFKSLRIYLDMYDDVEEADRDDLLIRFLAIDNYVYVLNKEGIADPSEILQSLFDRRFVTPNFNTTKLDIELVALFGVDDLKTPEQIKAKLLELISKINNSDRFGQYDFLKTWSPVS